jgi:hypothetical protein
MAVEILDIDGGQSAQLSSALVGDQMLTQVVPLPPRPPKFKRTSMRLSATVGLSRTSSPSLRWTRSGKHSFNTRRLRSSRSSLQRWWKT